MVDIKKLNKASSLMKLGDFKSAEKIYYELLRDYPNNESVLSFWGLFQIKSGNFIKAEKVLESAYKIYPSAATIAALAYVKFHNKKYDDSIILYEELFKYDKDSPKIFCKIILAFKHLKMRDFSYAYCQKFISKYPNDLNALVMMTQGCMDVGEFYQAEKYCAKAIELYPDNSESWIHAGLLQELYYCNEELAQECYKTAIQNGDDRGYYHLAVSLEKAGKYDESEKCFLKCINEGIALKESIPSLGILYLKQKKFEEGFSRYIQREDDKEIEALKNRWTGQDDRMFSNQKTILVYSDQGFGDCVNFSRYLSFLKDKFSKVIVFCKKTMKSLLERNFDEINFVSDYPSIEDYDVSVLISDLPYYLNIDFENIPSSKGYIISDKVKVKEYKEKYFNTDKLKIGLCWRAGSMAIRGAINRTINIDYLKPVLEMKNVEFYSFQKGDIFDGCKKYPQIIDLSDTFETFDDTISAIENVDLIISVDTVVAHLAGAMGKKTILLIPYCPDWRWFDNTEKTEWYDSVQIMKQQDRQDWFIEANRLKEYIKSLL